VTSGVADDFDYRNNVVANCNYVWTHQDAGSARTDAGEGRAAATQPRARSRYQVVNSYFAGNRRLTGSGTGARLEYQDIDSSFLGLVETRVTDSQIPFEMDQSKRGYLHPLANSEANRLGAGVVHPSGPVVRLVRRHAAPLTQRHVVVAMAYIRLEPRSSFIDVPTPAGLTKYLLLQSNPDHVPTSAHNRERDATVNDPARQIEHQRIHFALSLLRHRWTIPVLHRLCTSPTHFTDLHRDLGVSRKVLTAVLREMERDGLVQRHEPDKVGTRGLYALTQRGAELRPHLQGVAAWAARYADEIDMARAAYDQMSRAGQKGVTKPKLVERE
jgi:DNA-binding HxlR family transcriptional regulator